MNRLSENPFRVQGVVEPPFFTDRAEEVARIRGALEGPPAKLLVYGERRMGKTSALHVARLAVERAGGHVVFADLSTVSSPVDMANRVLEAATAALGRSWSDFLGDLTGRLRIRLQLTPDPATGLAVPTVEAGLRSREAGEQYDTFVGVLDALEGMAEARNATLGVVLDEFQEIHRFGGEDAEWRLRGVVQHHRRLGYVLAGSDASLIRAMLGRGRAFYELFEPLHFGPMDPDHLGRWIDERLAGSGVPCPGLGARAWAVAGPRTRDVVRVARASYEIGRVGGVGHGGSAGSRGPAPTGGRAGAAGPCEPASLVRDALRRLVAEEDDRMRATWDNLTELQQNVLRAVAWNGAGLTARATVERFGLGYGGTARNAALALEKRGLLRRSESVAGFSFDSPVVRSWVVAQALPDAGILVPIDHLGEA